MRKPKSVKSLEDLGRVRLSESFYMREFLYSEISNIHGIPNLPDHPDLAIEAGRMLCTVLLEPLRATFGGLAVRSAYRSPAVNAFGNKNHLNCATNETNRAGHIWDQRDAEGCLGARVSVVVPWFADRYAAGADWRALAWWIHDHLSYSTVMFYPKLAAFNITWREIRRPIITSHVAPKGVLTRPGMDNFDGDHSDHYPGFPSFKTA